MEKRSRLDRVISTLQTEKREEQRLPEEMTVSTHWLIRREETHLKLKNVTKESNKALVFLEIEMRLRTTKSKVS